MRIEAVVATRRSPLVIGHASAAVIWGIPVEGIGRSAVHTVVPPTSTARSKNGVTVHRTALTDEDVTEVDGLLVTTPERTLLDLARTGSFRSAVVALDFAVHPRRAQRFLPLSREHLAEVAGENPNRRGFARAARALEFALPGADNPGESISRVVIHELGFPTPLLQVRHPNPRGGFYLTDTEWPDIGVIGEFDGKGKYLKAEYLRGMTPGEAVYEEKIREDHLRDEGSTVTRWGWPELRNPRLLERKLLTAGVPRLSVRLPHSR